MPRPRLILWASLSAVVLVSWTVSMAAARDPRPRAPQEQGAPGQDPFDAAEKPGAKGKPEASGKSEKAADKKAAKKAEPEFVQKSLVEWQRILPRGVFQVTRLKATEPAFSGRFATGHFNGTFICACCGADLFSSKTKFDSGTGWPSFWQPLRRSAIDQAIDNSEAEVRMEVMCRRCGAHLGHVFDDGPPPTGLRFCINSLSLKLKPNEGDPARTTTRGRAKSKSKATRTRSKGTARSSKSAEKPSEGESNGSGAEATDATKTPETGKSDGSGR